jgi:hypothetical protein
LAQRKIAVKGERDGLRLNNTDGQGWNIEESLRSRDRLPKVRFAWEMSLEMAVELEKPLPPDYPDLDHLMECEAGTEGCNHKPCVALVP